MNIRLALEQDFSKNKINEIAEYACSKPIRFKKLMECFFDPYHRTVLAASWVLTKSIQSHKEMLEPYFPEIITQITNPNNAEHLIRNSLRILELIQIPETFHGIVMNTCFGFIEQPQAPIAIKAYSLTILFELSKTYPEIQEELKCIIEEKWGNETPAFKSRGRKILSQINKSRKKN